VGFLDHPAPDDGESRASARLLIWARRPAGSAVYPRPQPTTQKKGVMDEETAAKVAAYLFAATLLAMSTAFSATGIKIMLG
jgi:hypothetical protein